MQFSKNYDLLQSVVMLPMVISEHQPPTVLKARATLQNATFEASDEYVVLHIDVYIYVCTYECMLPMKNHWWMLSVIDSGNDRNLLHCDRWITVSSTDLTGWFAFLHCVFMLLIGKFHILPSSMHPHTQIHIYVWIFTLTKEFIWYLWKFTRTNTHFHVVMQVCRPSKQLVCMCIWMCWRVCM